MEDQNSNGEEKVDNFLLNLYNEVSVERRWSDELSDIASATKEMVNRIVTEAVSPYMKQYKSDGLTEVIVSEAGSMADGTSIIDPDEFDFTMAFVYSPDTIETQPSTNRREILLPKLKVSPKDPRFKQIYLNNKPLLKDHFVLQTFRRLIDALAQARDKGPVQRGNKYLCLCASDEKGTKYGIQGPSFHLHNLLKWCSPNRKTDFFISVDLVPGIQFKDKNMTENIPLFKQECPCEEHNLSRPEHGLLTPMKGREDSEYEDEFFNIHFRVSFSGYETGLLKQWKCEKSMYHNWYICYTLMKCFGTLDHDCKLMTKYNDGQTNSFIHFVKHESISSYSWKNMVFTKAMKECGKYLSLSQCFNCLMSVFKDANQNEIEIESFCCPPELVESIDISERNSAYAPFVKKMKCVKSMVNDIKGDPNFSYENYKKKLMDIFPELAQHL